MFALDCSPGELIGMYNRDYTANTLELNKVVNKQEGGNPAASARPMGQGSVLAVDTAPRPGVYTAPAGSIPRPPCCDTGDGHTKVFPDWFSLTFRDDSEEAVTQVLGWLTPPGDSPLSWTGLPRGLHGYTMGFIRQNIRVYFKGSAGMGVHVILNGQAVRQIETDFSFRGLEDWREWLAVMRSRGARFSRFDNAMDDKGPDGVLNMEVIKAAAKSCHVVTPFHKARTRNDSEFSLSSPDEAPVDSDSISFGKRTDSNMYVRIYNKFLEQLAKGHIPADTPPYHHVRVESEAKGKGAEEMVTLVIEQGFEAVARVLLHYLDFKVPNETDSNKSRWETAPWWSEFIGRVEKCRLNIPRPVTRTLEQTREWLTRQVSCSLALVVDAVEKDAKAAGRKATHARKAFIAGLVEGGRSRYKGKHWQLLDGYTPRLGLGL